MAGEERDPRWFPCWRLLLRLTLLSSVAWMILTTADMGESWNPTELWKAMSLTSFGHLWCVRVLLLLLLAIGVRRSPPSTKAAIAISTALAFLALISSLSGHSASQDSGNWWRVSLNLAHSLAAAVWSGGLLCLYSWLGTRLKARTEAADRSLSVVRRFSHLAMASTAILLATGLAMAWTFGVSFSQPWASSYGQLLLGKTFLFSLALGAAAVNQFVHLRRVSETEARFAAHLRREIRLEMLCVATVFLIAGFLTRTALPSDGLTP